MTPICQRCEYLHDPPDIDAPAPLLTWTLAGNGRQNAYQIQVTSNPEQLINGCTNLWDSGRVDGDTMSAPYGGQLLTSRTLCRWHVRVWDETGQPGNWSKPAVFEMGLLAATDWRTSWIGRPEHDTGKHIFTSQE